MRAVYAAVAAALSTGGAAIAAAPAPLTLSAPVIRIADATTGDDKAATTTDAPSPGAPPGNSGQLEVQPGLQPQKPAQPPNLNIPGPPATPSQPGRTGPEGPPPNERVEQHQEPPPRGQPPDELPRGEGAAMIPRETPSGIKAIEEWFASWFE